MVSSLLKQQAIRCFDEALQNPGSKTASEKAKLAWELMHLDVILGPDAFGPPIGPVPIDEPGGSQGGVSPLVVAELIRTNNYPVPPPDPNILIDRNLQRDAAIELRGKLEEAMGRLNTVIEFLEVDSRGGDT